MRNKLFRTEATEGLRPRLEGDVVALRPLSSQVIVGGAVALLAIGLTFSATTTYSKYVPAAGYLAPRNGLLQLVAPTTGELEKLSVSSGQSVRSGEVLAVIRNNQTLRDGSAASNGQKALVATRRVLIGQEAAARKAVLSAESATAEAKARSLESALTAAQGTRTSATRALALAAEQLERTRKLAEQGFVAPASVAAQEQAMADREYTLQQAEQTLASLRADVDAARAAARNARLQVEVTTATTGSAEVLLDAESLALEAARESAVTSPVDGQVVAVIATQGPIGAGAGLFMVSPKGALYAHVLISEASAAKARLGQKVVLRLTGSSLVDSLRASGVLESLSEGVVTRVDGGTTVAGHLALVKLAQGVPDAFRPGSRVDVRIETETRTLLGWLFEPLTRGMRQLDVVKAQ